MTTKFSDDLKELSKRMDENSTIESILREYSEKETTSTFGFLIALLALPVALPTPATGFATPFGICIIFISIALMANMPLDRIISRMPKKMRGKKVGRKLVEFTDLSSNIVGKLETFAKPRFTRVYQTLVFGRARYFLYFLLILVGIAMILPIPFTNTAPAAVAFIIGIGMMNRDGFLVLAGVILGPVGLMVYYLLVSGVIGLMF